MNPSMASTDAKKLHWTQRIALVRHNLHAGSRSGDFGFFKAVQAASLIEGTNHFATLSAMLGDEADMLMAAMDNLNSGLAYIHQDAFQAVHDSLKNSMRDSDKDVDRSKLYVDINMQRGKTEMAIDKLCNSATALIHQQPPHVQDEAANVFITGVTFIADCVEVVTKQLDTLDQKINDFIRLEESWNTVKGSVIAANAGLKGVFYMLDASEPQGEQAPRSLSIASAGSSVFRRLSSAFQSSPSPPSRTSSVASAGAPRGSISGAPSLYRTPTNVRNSVSAGCPTSMPPSTMNNTAFNTNSFNTNNFASHKLTTIPPTPATEEDLDPFDMTEVPPVPALPFDPQETGPMSPMSVTVM